MKTIRPEFHKCSFRSIQNHGSANEEASDSDAGSNTEVDTGADGGGALTLEMKDNSFQLLMNRIRWLLKSGLQEDIQEAYEMTRLARQNTDFGDDIELELTEKLDEIIGLIHKDRVLGNDFTKSVHDVRPEKPVALGKRPAHTLAFKLAA